MKNVEKGLKTKKKLDEHQKTKKMPLAAAAASCASPTKMLLAPHLLRAPGAHAWLGGCAVAARNAVYRSPA